MSMLLAGVMLASQAGGGGTPWTPADITTSLWLDPSDAANRTIVSSAYSALTDLSGNGNDASQGTAANRPALASGIINGLDAMQLDGSNDEMIVADSVSLQLGTGSFFVIAVTQFDNVSKGAIVANTVVSKNFTGFELYNYQASFYTYAGGTENQALSGATLSNSVTYLVDAQRNGSSFTAAVDATRGSISTNSADVSNVGQNLRIGFRPGGASGLHMDGYIGEIIMAPNGDINDLEKAQGYIAHKWGLEGSLPPGHPYKSSPPTV